MKKALALLLAAAMSLSLAACGGNGGTSAGNTGGDGSKSMPELDTGSVATAMDTAAESVTVAVDDDSFTIGPWGSDSAVRDWTETILWTHLAYRPFIGAAFEAGELELVAAKSVNAVDSTTYEVEIYDNIVDSAGNAIKASDVVFSYDKLAELGYVTEISTYYSSAEATGDYTLTINLKSDTEGAIEEVLCGCSIASESWYTSASQDEIEKNPATTGPYTVENMEIGASLTMAAKDNYWKTSDLTTVELQNVKKINLKCITEASMRSVALENGEVDMAEIAASDVSRFESGSDYNITRYMNAMSQYLIYNTSENSPMHDVNVRRAVSYATDSLTVMMGGGSDACVVSHDVAPNKGPDYVQDWDNQSYFEQDLDKAAECLAAAGYKPGELKLKILTSAQAPQGPYVALQAMLQEAGIELEIMALDRAARMGVQNDPTVWDIAEYSDVVTDFTTHFWSNLFNEDNYPGQGTQGFTQDPELQRLLKAAMSDRSEENMNAFHNYVVENCYMYGLYTEIRSIVTTKGLTNVCMQKENPVLNAMTFTGDYVPAV
ncbi:MAG: ABC transporter substrate-binding protein [Lawsonibacter sp.]|nr:ABC transporter substrate-binding protein [Lawsonibacter sp.]